MAFSILDPKIQNLIKKKGFIEPTLAQQLSIEPIVEGNNVLVIAPTGIGKTESCVLPFFHKLVQNEHKPISLLYLTPLKSLNRDLLDRLFWWADKLGLEIAVRHGDTSQSERAMQREAPPDILISTPETLQAILPGKIMKTHLSNVRYVVVDEIHELVESKRGIQMSLALERLREIAGDFQRVGLSATVGSPQLVADFLGDDVKIIRAEADKKYQISVEYPKPGKRDRAISDDLLIGLETTARLRRLYDLINKHESVIAFTNTRETAEVLSSRLRNLDRELKQEVHHGSLAKEGRIKSEQKFKKQELKSLVATSSLELGIDIGSIDMIVQYLSPRQVSKLIQRTGRSGHSIGRVSKAVILSGDEDVFESTVIANRAMGGKLEKIRIHDKALDVLVNQMAGIALDEYGVHSKKMYEIVRRAYPYRDLTEKEFDELLKFMSSLYLLWLNEEEDGYTINRSKKAWNYYFSNLSTIPDTRQYRVVSIVQNEPVGVLDEEFVAEHGHTGEKFVCGGRAWKVIQVEQNRVIVEPIDDIESAIPAWEGELIPVPMDIARGVGKIRAYIEKNLGSPKLAETLKKKYNIDANTAKQMVSIVRKHAAKHALPTHQKILIEHNKDFVIIHTCFGSLVNGTLARYLSSVLTAETGVSVNMKTDPYRIMLQTTASPKKVESALREAGNLWGVLETSVERSSMFRWRFLHVAKRMGIIRKDAQYDKINMNRIISNYHNAPVYRETLREIFLEKMDLEGAEEVVKQMRDGGVEIVREKGLSELGELGLVQQFSEVMKPKRPEGEVFRAFRRRLLKTQVRLLCVNCGKYNVLKTVATVDDQPECPRCHSRLIAPIRKRQRDAVKVIKKKLKGKELDKDEQKELQTVRRAADLTIVYGRRAVIALAGHGVGPQAASRILAMLYDDDEKFYKDILEAEKNFARTKIYWQ